jgi:hypothetical protein
MTATDMAILNLRDCEFKEFVSLTLVARESYGFYKSKIQVSSYISLRAKYNGQLAHVDSPKQQDKAFVKECWLEWHKYPSRYVSKAEFARDMLEKCEHLVSQDKISRWCKAWEKELEN